MKMSRVRKTPTGEKNNPRLLCCCSRLVFSSAAAYIAKCMSFGEKKIKFFSVPKQNECDYETHLLKSPALRWSGEDDFQLLLCTATSVARELPSLFFLFTQTFRPAWLYCHIRELTTMPFKQRQYPKLRLCPTGHLLLWHDTWSRAWEALLWASLPHCLCCRGGSPE